jgi:hypothetical protein
VLKEEVNIIITIIVHLIVVLGTILKLLMIYFEELSKFSFNNGAKKY